MVCRNVIGAPLGTTFTYQGRLAQDGLAAQGIFDFHLRLYDAETLGNQIGPTIPLDDVTVTGGLFTVELDFGDGVFAGDVRWLEVSVREGLSTGTYTVLNPRQRLAAAPYALYCTEAGDAESLDGLDSTAFLPTTGGSLTGGLTVSGLVHSTSGGFRFPDGTTQTSAASGGDGHSLDAADGNPTDVVFVDNAGNVGIATATPSAKLSVNGSFTVGEGATAGGSYATALGQISTASGANALSSGFNSTASGNHAVAMGLGPTASGIASVALGDNSKATGNLATATGSFTTAQSYASFVAGRWNEIAGSTTSWVSTDPLFVLGNGSSSGSRSNAVTVLKNGRVGIGKSNPIAELDVKGKIVWGNSLAQLSTDQGASIELRGTGSPYIDFSNDTGTDFDMRIGLSGDNSLTIEGGNVGIGGTVTNPVYKLELPNVAGPGGQGRANDWIQYSSVRWKERISTIDDAIDKLRGLRGVEFDWKEDYGGGHGLGFVAEEVGAVLPELVEWEDEGPYAEGLSYSGVLPVLVEAMKEQLRMIERQGEEIERLKALIEATAE